MCWSMAAAVGVCAAYEELEDITGPEVKWSSAMKDFGLREEGCHVERP